MKIKKSRILGNEIETQDWYVQLINNSADIIKECRRWSWLLKNHTIKTVL